MSCARVLYRLLAYLQFIYGHLLLLECSEILFPCNCSFLELASSVAGVKLFPCLMYCSRSGVSEAVFLSFRARILLCRPWGQAGEGTSLLIQHLNVYRMHCPVQQTGWRPDPNNSIFPRWTGFSQARRELATENSRKEPRDRPCFGSDAKSFCGMQ